MAHFVMYLLYTWLPAKDETSEMTLQNLLDFHGSLNAWLPVTINFFSFNQTSLHFNVHPTVVFQVVLNLSEQSLDFNWAPRISTSRTVAE